MNPSEELRENNIKYKKITTLLLLDDTEKFLDYKLTQVEKYTDNILVVLNNINSDNLNKIKQFKKIKFIHINPKGTPYDEVRDLNKLLEIISNLKLETDWILILKENEIFEEIIIKEIQILCNPVEFNIKGYFFPVYTFWDTEKTYRIDSCLDKKKVFRLFKYTSEHTRFIKKGYQCYPLPTSIDINNTVLSDIRLKYYGHMNQTDVLNHYQKLKFSIGNLPKNLDEFYKNLLDESKIQLLYWKEDKTIQPTLSLCMIVKNEESNLSHCLDSVKDLVDEIIIVDTGSEDKTVEIAHTFGAKVFYFKWCDDFSKARNYAISKVTSDWILFLDADEYINKEDHIKIKEVIRVTDNLSVFLPVISLTQKGETRVFLKKLFKNHPEVFFTRQVYEELNRPKNFMTSKIVNIPIYHTGYLDNNILKQKVQQNIKILLKSVQINSNIMDYFYLCHSYYLIEEWEECIKWGEKFLLTDNKDTYIININSYMYNIYFYMALSFFNLENYEKSLLLIKEAISWDKNLSSSYILMSEIYLKENKLKESIDTLKIIFSLKPVEFNITSINLEDYKYNPSIKLANIYYKLNDITNTKIYLKKALSYKPNDPYVIKFLQDIEKICEISSPISIGIQLPTSDTFDKAVWGDEVMAVGMLESFYNLPFVESVEILNPITVHDNLDLIINFYPIPITRLIKGPINLWWYQAPVDYRNNLKEILNSYDGFIASSLKLLKDLERIGCKNVIFLPMSVNTKIFKPVEPVAKYSHDIVFCGNFNNLRTISDIEKYIFPLIKDFDFRIYGSGWEVFEDELKGILQGPINPKELPLLYSSSKIVLSCHSKWHRENDVPTSRLWEALACGAFVISDELPTAKKIFKDSIVWTKGGEDLKEKVKYYLNNKELRTEKSKIGREIILREYNFDTFVNKIIDLYKSILKDRQFIGRTKRTQTLSLCMIVKNEEKNIAHCLESVKDLVDEIIIVDTGSEDKTVEIARTFGANIFYYKWNDNFSAAKNYALSNATSDWILFLDADEYINKEDHLKIKNTINSTNNPVILLKIVSQFQNSSVIFLGKRLFKRHPEIKYKRPVHEDLSFPEIISPISIDVSIYHKGYTDNNVLKQKIRERDIKILLNNIKTHPEDNLMDYIFLSHDYYILEEWEKCIEYGEKAIKLSNKYSLQICGVLMDIADSLIQLGKYDQAFYWLEKVLSIEKNLARIYILKADIYLRQNKYISAIEELKKIFFLKIPEISHIPLNIDDYGYNPNMLIAFIYKEKLNDEYKSKMYVEKALLYRDFRC